MSWPTFIEVHSSDDQGRSWWIPKDELGARIQIEPTGGTFSTYLSTLRSNGLAEVNAQGVRAGEALFL